MIEATLHGIGELLHEIWDVDEDPSPPPIAQATGRIAERLTNLGTVLIYGVLVAYAGMTLLRLVPRTWLAGAEAVQDNWWFWVGLVLVVVTALRWGLNVTKALKRWNVASLLGSLLLFDLLLKRAPTLFGCSGFSPIDGCFSVLGDGELSEFLQKALGA